MADHYADYLVLRDLMIKTAPMMQIGKDTQGDCTLNVPPVNIMASKDPVWFGSVRMGKSFVSYYLMPLSQPALYAKVPENLKKFMQGRTCFNIHTIEPDILLSLEAVTRLATEQSHVPAKAS